MRLKSCCHFFLASEGMQYEINVRFWSYSSFIITVHEMENGDRFIAYTYMPVLLFASEKQTPYSKPKNLTQVVTPSTLSSGDM